MMTEPAHPMRRRTDLLPNPSDRWWTKRWNAFVSHLTATKAPMGLIYLGGFVVLFGWWAVQHQQQSIVDTQRAADLRATAQALYQQQASQWSSDSAAYALCLDSVSRSDLNRQQWQDIVDGLETLGAAEFAERVRTGPVLSSPPRESSECDNPGPPPEPPDDTGLLADLPASVGFITVR